MAGQGAAGYTIRDYSKESANSRMNVGVVDALSLPGLLTNLGNFQTALQGVIIGKVYKNSLSVYDNIVDETLPTNHYAQREIRWIVHYQDTQAMFGLETNTSFGRKYTVEFACPDLSLLLPNSDIMNIASGAGATFKTNFEGTFLAPSGGTLAVDFIELVGRKG